MRAQQLHTADELLTINQAAVVLNIHPKSVQRAIWRGALPTVGVEAIWPHSRRRLRRRDVERYAANRKTWKGKRPWPSGMTAH